jgi:acyl transferase domain-containing protein
MTQKKLDEAYTTAIAVIGMSGRFPGANTVEEFWTNIAGGQKAIHFFSDDELLAAGVTLEELKQPNYVKAGTVLPDIEKFDAAFFGYTQREAEIIDPQQRVLLEVAWEALEVAGYNVETYTGMIGVFAGAAVSTYLLNNLSSRPDIINLLGQLSVSLGNDKDSLATRLSYKLNLRGPAIAVQTYCSSSLVSVHLGCQSLLNYECDMILAGGVAIAIPQVSGYLYQEGGLLPPDGESRPFDIGAKGSLKGKGAGMVVLKRFSEAVENGDHIYAVIRGSAVNNDGRFRVSYAAPGLEGQSEVIAEALANADVEAESIGYIEAHGTATELGDSIELAALTKAFALTTSQERFCAIGSVKPNIGHLDHASGITGLIKTTLALQQKQLPACLNFTKLNPDINLSGSPFYINTSLAPWPKHAQNPRRGGVSSFGIGGTNAHVILEEAPEREPGSLSRPEQLLFLSARTERALQRMSENLALHLRQHSELELADVAYTLQVGRALFPYRRMLICKDPDEAMALLEQPGSPMQMTSKDQRVTFWLNGMGSESAGLAREIFAQEPFFRETVNRCLNILKQRAGLDLTALFKGDGASEQAVQQLQQSAYAQPATFLITYALAQLFVHWGIQPRALLGDGWGEYVAACLSGVFSLDDALLVVARQAEWMQAHATGETIEAVQEPMRALLDSLQLHAPTIPYVSSVTGTWITPEQATSSTYWLEHIGCDVRQGIETLLQEKQQVILEIGSAQALSSSVKQLLAMSNSFIFPVLPERGNGQPALRALLSALGNLWLTGVQLDWAAFYEDEQRLRVSLPTYPFDRQRCWIEPARGSAHRNLFDGGQKMERASLPGNQTIPLITGQAFGDSGTQMFLVNPDTLSAGLAETLKAALIRGEIQAITADLQKQLQSRTSADDEMVVYTVPLDRSNLSSAYAPPENPIEESIVHMWEELLGSENIGIRDNFFELGGHSLIGTQLVSRLRQTFQVDVPLAILFDTATIENLALIVGELLLAELEQQESLIAL